ncbi:hypothetical protein V2G26_018256 [Clonostachys chloroleuca]
MAVAEGIIHAIIALSLQPVDKDTIHSGWMTFAAFLARDIFSLCMFRIWLRRWFLLSHRVMTLGGLAAMSCMCYSAVASWHLPDETHPCRQVSNVPFLFSRHGNHLAALSNLTTDQHIRLEGPFGKNLHLKKFENVILAAQGIGITAVLPLALELAERKRHDDDIKNEIQSIYKQKDLLPIDGETVTFQFPIDIWYPSSAIQIRPQTRSYR